MEAEWSKEQKEISMKRVAQSFEKRKRSTEVVNIILRKCIEHNGPFTSVEELQAFVSSSNPKEIKKLLRVEMQLKKITNKEDNADRPELYKVNNLSAEEFITNMAIILASDVESREGEDIIFESSDEIMEILSSNTTTDEPNQYKKQDLLAVYWDTTNDFREWYIGFFLDTNEDGTIRVDHLTRLNKQQSIDWKRPT